MPPVRLRAASLPLTPGRSESAPSPGAARDGYRGQNEPLPERSSNGAAVLLWLYPLATVTAPDEQQCCVCPAGAAYVLRGEPAPDVVGLAGSEGML